MIGVYLQMGPTTVEQYRAVDEKLTGLFEVWFKAAIQLDSRLLEYLHSAISSA